MEEGERWREKIADREQWKGTAIKAVQELAGFTPLKGTTRKNTQVKFQISVAHM